MNRLSDDDLNRCRTRKRVVSLVSDGTTNPRAGFVVLSSRLRRLREECRTNPRLRGASLVLTREYLTVTWPTGFVQIKNLAPACWAPKRLTDVGNVRAELGKYADDQIHVVRIGAVATAT